MGKPLFAISTLLCGSLGTALVMFDKVLRGRDMIWEANDFCTFLCVPFSFSMLFSV
jgi:hypothetical protein